MISDSDGGEEAIGLTKKFIFFFFDWVIITRIMHIDF